MKKMQIIDKEGYSRCGRVILRPRDFEKGLRSTEHGIAQGLATLIATLNAKIIRSPSCYLGRFDEAISTWTVL